MTNSVQVIPGQVINNGIYDGSIPVYKPETPTYPCHFPVFAAITPKGPLGHNVIPTKKFTSTYGDIMDVNSPYFNPVSLAIQSMSAGGQASFGFRRLSGNKILARKAIGLKITKGQVKDRERNEDGSWKLNERGEYVEKMSQIDVLTISLVAMDISGKKKVGELKKSHDPSGGGIDAATSVTYPICEFISGVGDYYNLCGFNLGIADNTDWQVVADFVERNGVYPFKLREFISTEDGILAYAKTVTNQDSTTMTFFDFTDDYNTNYGPKYAIGSFTNSNLNRPSELREAPINDIYVYRDNIDELAKTLFAFESTEPSNKLIKDSKFAEPYRQMNFLTAVNHMGIPYYKIRADESMMVFMGRTGIFCEGGISPFKNDDGEWLEEIGEAQTIFGVEVSAPTFDRMKGWAANQKLIEADLMEYADSSILKNWTRNRQSFIWDLGYNEKIKDLLIKVWNARKDHVLMLDASVYGTTMSVDQKYSLATSLTTKLRLNPESELYGTGALRAGVNLWCARYIDDASNDRYSLNLDLIYQYAKHGGNTSNMLYPSRTPSSGENRVIQLMHDPDITMEEDELAASDFANGCITVAPYDSRRYYRPALVGVYKNPDSVLKDLDNAFTAVCIEKVCQDQWLLVSGDTTISKIDYAARTKDNCERKCRRLFNGMFSDIQVDAFYDEGTPGGRARMKLNVSVWFNKAKYMMEMSLLAFNEEDKGKEQNA